MNDFLQLIGTLVSGAGDPNLIARLIPDSQVWPHYLALTFRSYRLPEFFYWIGLGLVLLGLALGALSYMAGRVRFGELLLRFFAVGVLWQAFVILPGMVGCKETKTEDGSPSLPQVPCVLSGDWVVRRGELVEQKVPVGVVNPDGSLTITNVQVQHRPVYQVSFNPRPEGGKPSDKDLPFLLKGMWSNFNRLSNQALFRELARQQQGIAESKKALNQAFMAVLLGSGVGGAVSTLANILQGVGGGMMTGTGKGGPLGALVGLLGFGLAAVGGGVEATADAATRLIQGLGGVLISAMIFGPVALLTIYHAINTLSGLLLYTVLFSAPVILGIAALGHMQILGASARLVILSLLVPLVTGPVFGMAFRVVYGGLEEKARQVQKLSELAGSLITKGDMTRSFRTVMLTEVATKQLAATYYCAKSVRDDGKLQGAPGFFCPEDVRGLFYANATDYQGKVGALVEKQGRNPGKPLDNLGKLLESNYANIPALLFAPSGSDTALVKKAREFVKDFDTIFGGDRDPTSFTQSRASYETFMALVKKYAPGYVWSWKAFVEARKQSLGVTGGTCQGFKGNKDDVNVAQKHLFLCLGEALGKASDQIPRKDVENALTEAKKVDKTLKIPDGWTKNTVTYDTSNENRITSTGFLSGDAHFMGKGALSSPSLPLEPEAPLYGIDTGYITLLIANSLPQALQGYAQGTWLMSIVATLFALFMSIAIVGLIWGLLGQLLGVSGGLSAEVSSQVAGFLGASTAVGGVNLLSSVPRTTGPDLHGRRLGEEYAPAVRRWTFRQASRAKVWLEEKGRAVDSFFKRLDAKAGEEDREGGA